jgi:hypothetical protein
MILNHQRILFAFLVACCLFFCEATCNLTPLHAHTHTKKTHACAPTRMQLAMIVRCGFFASTIAVLVGSVEGVDPDDFGCNANFCGSRSSHPQIPSLPLIVSRVNMAICSHHAITPLTHAHLCICRTMPRRKLCHRLHGQKLRQYVTPPPDPPPAIVSKPCQYGHLFTPPCDNATNNTHAHFCICSGMQWRRLCHRLHR